MTNTYKDWHKKLSFALHAHPTSSRTSNAATSFSVVNSIEVVLPIGVEIHSLRILMEMNQRWRSGFVPNSSIETLRRINMWLLVMGNVSKNVLHEPTTERSNLEILMKAIQVSKKSCPLRRILMKSSSLNEGVYLVTNDVVGGALYLYEMDKGPLHQPTNLDCQKIFCIMQRFTHGLK